MALDLFDKFHSFFWVFLKESHDQIFQSFTSFLKENGFSIQYFLKHFASVIIIEGRNFMNELIKTAAKSPPIEGSSMSKTFNHLRCSVFRSSTS